MSFFSKWFKPHEPPKRISKDIQDAKERIAHLGVLTDRLDSLEMASFNQFELLRIAADNLDIAIWGKNKHGLFIFLNRACAEKILHSTVEEALNMTDADFDNDALAHVCMMSDNQVMDTGETMRFIEHASYEGKPFWVDCTKSPWLRNGRLIGTVGSAKDITSMVPVAVIKEFVEPQSINVSNELVLCADELMKLLE